MEAVYLDSYAIAIKEFANRTCSSSKNRRIREFWLQNVIKCWLLLGHDVKYARHYKTIDLHLSAVYAGSKSSKDSGYKGQGGSHKHRRRAQHGDDINDEKDQQELWEVERIVARRIRNGKEEYMVHWKGFDDSDDTYVEFALRKKTVHFRWEPSSSLVHCQETLNAFYDSQQTSS